MNSPVSVVMPARNAETTVSEAIESIRKQTFENLEIVLVDHDSSDNTLSIMKEAAGSDSRIRVFRESGTFIEAANRAWREAEGELIARMDSDDVSHPERIAAQVDFLSSNPGIAGCGTLVNITKRDGEIEGGYRRYESWVNSVVSSENIAAQRFVDSPLPNPTSMIRRTVMRELGGYADPSWAEDYDLWLRLLENGHRLGKVDRVLLDWFDGSTRATRTRERYALTRFQEAKAHYLSRLRPVQDNGVVVCGAGPIGKEMAGMLIDRNIDVRAFIEVNVRQIGNRIREIPVLSSEELSNFKGKAVALGAVGQPGKRRRVLELAESANFVEGIDFFSVA